MVAAGVAAAPFERVSVDRSPSGGGARPGMGRERRRLAAAICSNIGTSAMYLVADASAGKRRTQREREGERG